MKPLAPLSALLFGLFGLVVGGCGGLTPGVPESYELTPQTSTVAPGASLTLTARITEAPYSSLEFAVVEGSAGGTVVETDKVPGTEPTAIYTAPAKTGTYHVRLRVLNGDDVAATRTSTITVRTGG